MKNFYFEYFNEFFKNIESKEETDIGEGLRTNNKKIKKYQDSVKNLKTEIKKERENKEMSIINKISRSVPNIKPNINIEK